ncbi:carbon-nitrogen hydrolase family protein [Marinobacter sp. M3C]|jgi:nitrilase|uniref:carbon-nitrogen hydrolase family protein n=1 Tax=unclassified Marinobacter TaxID=83889 RepID=UPI00200DA49F|nr:MULTISPECIES: carbon-nitrogen hydrolase family protein [unclassified Marinobacter]MCL1479544.1 carbon-nitrogen hydrolase family protein [Marinobacter sp.]MCL1482613.1 carbon-nitrogen hydrolase family protein [Marinobacter sp.]MCL1485538.1 carbon-nitrogen hydrolase family protein [Marinobacter sp.]MCL1489085.1 carbon-nitrogen hydrolase family protein [Marinobacter sp.]UQG54679.1 carbon-nitrogen hydrolase family protein [Marinobacter sp. M4C]
MTQQSSALVAALQMVSGHQLQDNLNAAAALLQQAAEAGVKVAVLPENFAVLASDQMLPCGQQEAGSESIIRTFLAQQAKTLKLWIVGGSLPLALRPDGSVIADRVRASCLVFNDLGDEVARYDKIHLFDAQVDDAHGQYRESDTFEAGDQVITVDTPAGRLGLAVCYDLRFPELFRALRDKGADWVCLPSAFTWKTGNAHWHALIRARAIENQLYVVAAGQGGHNSSQRRTYGHSLICDPWGSVLAEVNEDGPGIVTAALDKHWLDQLRQQMPVWSHRRL